MHFSLAIQNLLTNIKNFWINTYWKRPNNLWALKVTITIAILLIPNVMTGHLFWGATLGMGVVGTALAETDVHPIGRLKSLSITLIGVFISSLIIELLHPYPVWFGIWLVLSTFILIIIGGISSRHQGITFGIILISIYTLLGLGVKAPWYYQPILLTLGGLVYGIISMTIFYSRPWRLLEEEIAVGFLNLSSYIEVKSRFFPSSKNIQENLRNELAQKNVQVVDQMELCKKDLINFKEESHYKSSLKLKKFYRLWMLLQEIHERAASSHEEYDILSENQEDIELIEGFGQILFELSKAVKAFADSMLTNTTYKHPVSLKWATSAQIKMMQSFENNKKYNSFSLLMNNLMELENLLRNITHVNEDDADHEINYSGKNVKQSLKQLLNINHPRFKFAIRLSFCFLVGYLIVFFFKIENGYWIILTSFIVCQQTYSATRQRLFHRIFGTIAGVFLGIILAKLLPTLAGQILLLLGSIYLFFYWVKGKYTYAVIFITVFVLASFNIQFDKGTIVMLPRLIDTIEGSLIAFIAVRFIWPDWQYKQLPNLLLNAIAKNKRYFDSIYSKNLSEEEYNHVRRRAHIADSSLTMAWKGMRWEPKNKRNFQKKAFNLTYLNHAILSYISAFGIHNFEANNQESLKHYQNISWILQQSVQVLSNEDYEKDNLAKAKEIEAGLFNAKMEGNQKESALFHNMARISTEVLAEAIELKQSYI